MFRTGPTLVLRKFAIDDDPSSGSLVDITGRASGIMEWLLTTLGLGAETNLKVTNEVVTIERSSLSGQTHHVVPLRCVSSVHTGYSKPIVYLILGAIVLIVSILVGLGQGDVGESLLNGLILGGVFLIAYYLSKKIVISIETSGGMILGLSFKRSVVENVDVGVEQAMKAIKVINRAVVDSQAGISQKG